MLQTILLVAMIIISVALSGVILLQKSEGGALGMGGGGGGGGILTARGAANLQTRTTSILAVLFFVCAISLTIAGNMERGSRSVIDADAIGSIAIGDQAPAAAGAQPAEPAAPTRTAPSLDDLEASLPAASAPAPAPTQ